jgi:hypothetical protein
MTAYDRIQRDAEIWEAVTKAVGFLFGHVPGAAVELGVMLMQIDRVIVIAVSRNARRTGGVLTETVSVSLDAGTSPLMAARVETLLFEAYQRLMEAR